MAGHRLYISPEYNPHSLHCDWGFFMRTQMPHIHQALTHGGNLGTLRQALFDTAKARTTPSRAQDKPIAIPPGPKPANVSTEAVSDDAAQLYRDVGLDTLALALLADVPINRPLHLTHNNLVGHWRWLRQVWRSCASVPRITTAPIPAKPQHDIVTALWQGRNNTAIALLRQSFQQLISNRQVQSGNSYQTFLASLTVFCPFIATELLWRHGLITASKDKGRIE